MQQLVGGTPAIRPIPSRVDGDELVALVARAAAEAAAAAVTAVIAADVDEAILQAVIAEYRIEWVAIKLERRARP